MSDHFFSGADVDLVGSLPCAVLVLTLDGRVISLNTAAGALLGWSADDIEGDDPPHVPAWATDERADLIRRAAAGETCSAVTQRITKDGQLVDVQLELSPVYAPSGAPVALICALRDVTEELAGRHELAERQRMMEELSDAVRHINGDLDVMAVLQRACDSAIRLLGSTGAGFVVIDGDMTRCVAQQGVSPAAVGISWPTNAGLIRRVFETGGPVVVPDVHAVVTPAPGALAWLHGLHTMVCVPATQNGSTLGAIYVAFTDVDHPVSANELDLLSLLASHVAAAYANASEHAEVTRARSRQQALIDATADGMALLDGEGVVLSWNTAAETLTGVPRELAVGAAPPLAVRGPGPVVDQQLPNGRWVEIIASAVPGTAETVLDFRDITAPKRLEEARELFVATMSHELRTPLTVVRGFAGTLLHRWDELTDDERRAAVRTIVARTESLGKLVEQLVLGARGDDVLDVRIGAFDLAAVLRDALAGLESLSASHPLVVDLPDELPAVRGDPSTIDTIVGQLVENAVKYSPGGGDIRVTAGVDPDAESVTVCVIDEGIGLAVDHTDLVFERFYQVPWGEERGPGELGLGLGLFIVRRLVQAQGGTVGARGNAEAGTTVKFSLPRADRRRAGKPAARFDG